MIDRLSMGADEIDLTDFQLRPLSDCQSGVRKDFPDEKVHLADFIDAAGLWLKELKDAGTEFRREGDGIEFEEFGLRG